MIRVEYFWVMVQGIVFLPSEGPTNSQTRFKLVFSRVPAHGFGADSGEQSHNKVACTENWHFGDLLSNTYRTRKAFRARIT